MRLILRLYSPNHAGSEHEFDERGGVIGRSSECDWVLECPQKSISRRHAVIAFEQDRFWLYDASANGVFHNHSAEPIGAGWRVPLEDNDSFRMGDFIVQTALVDVAGALSAPAGIRLVEAPVLQPVSEPTATPPVASPSRAVQPIEALDFGSMENRGAPATSLQRSLANTLDEFQPPRISIPDDWDFSLEPDSSLQPEAPTAVVNRRLMGGQVEASEALWAALLFDEASDAPSSELTPELAEALGRGLRVCIDGLFALRAEFDAVEQELTGKKRPPEGEAPEPTDAVALRRSLLAEGDLGSTVSMLDRMVADMHGRHADVVSGFKQSVDTIIGQFTPQKFQERWDHHRNGDAGKAAVSRVTSKLGLKAGFWSFYHDWHEEQQSVGYKTVHQLFEKMFLSIYARRQKGKQIRADERGLANGGSGAQQ